MEINDKNIKLWSTIGPRASIGLYALELGKQYKELIILTSDVSTSAGLDRFRKQFKEKFFEVGIAEQNLIGVAAGLSSEGFKIITTTFAPFQTLRCCEQIKVNLSYMQLKVCMIGLASGLVLGNLGYTHCSIEDIGVLRSLPNIAIISPADSLETLKAIESALKYHQSVYIRITGSNNNPIVYKNDYNFEIGKAITLFEGDDVCIFSNGAIINEAIKAREYLIKEKISLEVVNVHTIKPIDKKKILNSSSKKKLILTLEEHNVIGGLGSAISEVLAESNENQSKLIRIGIQDSYDKGGDYSFLKKKNNLDFEKIVSLIKKNL